MFSTHYRDKAAQQSFFFSFLFFFFLLNAEKQIVEKVFYSGNKIPLSGSNEF